VRLWRRRDPALPVTRCDLGAQAPTAISMTFPET
jgi:hypothetical protein